MDQQNNSKKKLRKPSIPIDTGYGFGKVPPQARDLEEAVLGAIMLEKTAIDKVATILTPETFYSDANQRIYKSMISLMAKRLPIDLLTVVEELRSSEELDLVGGPYAVTKLTNAVVSAANIEPHARIVLQKYLSRELIRIGSEITIRGYDDTDDVFSQMDNAEELLSSLRFGNIQASYRHLRDVMYENIKRIEDLRYNEDLITGVPSGFPDLDMITSGWQSPDLVILAARPSVGKTAFALTMAKAAANGPKKVPVGLFSLEMDDRSLVNRILASESKVWLWRIRNAKVDDHATKQIYDAAERLNECNIYIDDTSGITIQNLKSKARLMVKNDGVGLIIVDYLQLVNVPNISNREQQISTVSRELKGLAKELKVPVIALSQLSREIEKRADPRPMLSDLRESGAIEQDADLVCFLHKPTEKEVGENGDLLNVFYFEIAKNRNGALAKMIGEFTGVDQTHSFLKLVDGAMKPIERWDPVATVPVQAGLNFYESTKEQTEGIPDDAPF